MILIEQKYGFRCSSVQRTHEAGCSQPLAPYSSDWIVAQVQALTHWRMGGYGGGGGGWGAGNSKKALPGGVGGWGVAVNPHDS